MAPRNWVVVVIVLVLIIAFIALARGPARTKVTSTERGATVVSQRVQ